MTEKVYEWKQEGEIYMWRYLNNAKNFPGFHMSWNNRGRSSFCSFIEFLAASSLCITRTIKLSRPSRSCLMIPNNGRSIITRNSAKITLCDVSELKINEKEEFFEIALSKTILKEINDILSKSNSRPNDEFKVGLGASSLNIW